MNKTSRFLLSSVIIAMLSACGSNSESFVNSDIQEEHLESSELDVKAKAILSQMTVEQKINIVSGMGMAFMLGSLGEIDRVPGTAGYTHPYPELGIESIALADGPAGLRIWPTREGDDQTYYATAFPVATLVASTWNEKLVTQIGEAMGNEVKEYGVDVLLAPGMNIHKNPLTGRNFEYYSEDPLLSGSMAAAMVNGVESNGVGATIKHFVANNIETNRIALNTIVSERALREIYLKGFEIAVKKSDPWAIMSAYNPINGTPASEHKGLLTDVLRGEWNYQGVVMTDWFGGTDPVEQLKAGNDLLMPGVKARTELVKQGVEKGTITEADLDINVERILKLVLKSPIQNGFKHSNKPDLKAHAKLTRDVAAEGTVLLKNEMNTLPLAGNTNMVGAFGVGAYAYISGGTGSGDVNEAYSVSMVEGLANANINVDKTLANQYIQFRKDEIAKRPKKENFFMPDTPLPEMPLDTKTLQQVVKRTQIGLITLGRNSGEFADRTVEGDFYLTAAEKDMIKNVSAAYHAAGKKVVMVLNVGNVVEMKSWQDDVDAIILPWQGGQEGGNALSDVLTGKVNPSGRLPTTFPVSYSDVPSSEPHQFPGIANNEADSIIVAGIDWGKPAKVWYEDDIYVGYRYFDTFNVDVTYPFGYGLSYTTFSIESDLAGQSVKAADSVSVPVTVTNTGSIQGKQVVQLYVSAPKGKLAKPAKELRSFAKSKDLKPGESQTLSLEFNLNDLASYDSEDNAWLLEKGDYKLHVATSVEDIVFSVEMHLDESKVVAANLTELETGEPLSVLKTPTAR